MPSPLIRLSQLELLRRRRIEDALVNSMHELYPRECAALPPEAPRGRVRHAVNLAPRFKVDDLDDLLRLCEIGFLLGDDFESRIPFVSVILEDTSLGAVRERLQTLHTRARMHLASSPR